MSGVHPDDEAVIGVLVRARPATPMTMQAIARQSRCGRQRARDAVERLRRAGRMHSMEFKLNG